MTFTRENATGGKTLHGRSGGISNHRPVAMLSGNEISGPHSRIVGDADHKLAQLGIKERNEAEEVCHRVADSNGGR